MGRAVRAVAVVAAAAALASPGAARTPGCDEDCVCDGVDLSHLGHGATFEMSEIVIGPHGEGPNDWMYRISVCEPLPHEQIPINCRTGIGHPWHAPHVVRFKRQGNSRNESDPHKDDCFRVGSDVVLARATHHDHDPLTNNSNLDGVQLVFTGEDGGQTHTVTANLVCDRAATEAPPNAVRFEHFGSNPATALLAYTFDWVTEGACPAPPPPPCDGCVCAGVDLSLLEDSFGASGFSHVDEVSGQPCEPSNSSCGLHLDGWQYKMSFCRAVTQDEFEPGQCDGADGKNDVNSWNARVVQFAAKDNVHVTQEGCSPVGTAVTHAERTEHGVKLTWEDTQTEGLHRKVEGTLVCMEDGIGHIDRMEMEEVIYTEMKDSSFENQDSSLENQDSSFENQDSSLENQDSSPLRNDVFCDRSTRARGQFYTQRRFFPLKIKILPLKIKIPPLKNDDFCHSDEVTEFSFQFTTMAACAPQTPTPAPPNYPADVCSAECVCDGEDLSHLKGQTVDLLDANPASKWAYRLAICGSVDRGGLPATCSPDGPGGGVALNATALRYETESADGTEPLCEQLGAATVKAAHTIDSAGAMDGVDLVYSWQSEECRGGCEVQLKVQCSSTDAAAPHPGAMFDISTPGDLNGGSEYFSMWVAPCQPAAPAPENGSGHVLVIVLVVVAVVVVLVGAAFAVKRRRDRSTAGSGSGLEDPINSDMKTSW